MSKSNILLKKDAKIEFIIRDNGFQLVDEQASQNSGFYDYDELQSIELNKTWFPTFAKWLRAFTWIFNGVPIFPDAESYKKASVIIHLRDKKIGVWLTDAYMVDKAKVIKQLLDQKNTGLITSNIK